MKISLTTGIDAKSLLIGFLLAVIMLLTMGLDNYDTVTVVHKGTLDIEIGNQGTMVGSLPFVIQNK